MAHKIYTGRLTNDIRNLIQTSNEIEKIRHLGLRGGFRETSLGKIFKNYLPIGYELGSGEVIDSENNTSRETDLLIYNKSLIPPILFSIDEGCFPIESCHYIFEIKSTSNANEIQTSIQKFNEIRNLKYTPNNKKTQPICVYFAYATDITEISELERYSRYDKNFWTNPVIDVICIIGKGYWYCQRDQNQQRIIWYFNKSEKDNYEVGLFLSGIINTLSSVNQFGYYTIDNDIKREIAAYIDIKKELIITFDKIKFLNSGLYHIQNGNFTCGFVTLSKAIETKEKYSAFLLDEGYSLFNKKLYKEALLWILEAISNEDTYQNSYLIYHRIGLCYDNLGDVENAIYSFELALKINPGDTNIKYCLGYCIFKISNQDTALLEESLNLMNSILDFNPYDEEALRIRFMIKVQLNDQYGAKIDILKAISINPNNYEYFKSLQIVEHNIRIIEGLPSGESLIKLTKFL
ncbi:DUF6602 domain-containing protein [Leptospira perdikensis]|uniref:Tetratricopeptide repeat protein n=1 Tax=Leptospira perdikensis TaxID=2484948 RepID=A0A4V3JNP7_9LEPT|nr:DUF6602 domain-containing protein [Leptospira perdikensis]TGL36057.1 tetratricopeptide repeat protein [Leptospira perdikensis]